MVRVVFHTVVCAVKDPVRGTPALQHASFLARLHGADVRVLHVTSRPHTPAGSVQRTTPDVLAPLRAKGGRHVEDVSTRWIVANGYAPIQVAQHAVRSHADLVVVGRSADAPADHVVAMEVLRRAVCPVFVTRTTEACDEATPAIRTILCGVSSGLSTTTLRYALSLAQDCQARVTLLNIQHPSRQFPGEIAVRRDVEHLADLIPSTAPAWCEIEQVSVRGNVVTTLSQVSEAVQPDLIVIGAAGNTVSPRDAIGPVGRAALDVDAHVLFVPWPAALVEHTATDAPGVLAATA